MTPGPEMMNRLDFSEFRADVKSDFAEVKEMIAKLQTYQQEQNDRVSDIDKLVAVHEEKLLNIKDSRGRLLTVGIGVGSLVLNWVMTQWK